MDDARFDALTRRLQPRRTALASLLGGAAALLNLVPEETTAHNPVPACQKIKDAAKRQACLRRARRHNRRQHDACKPKPTATFCANRCGVTRNNCKKKVSCKCPAGKSCLANKACNRTCSAPDFVCPEGCLCTFLAENHALTHCYQGPPFGSCEQIPLPCVTSANCPRGYFCADVSQNCGTDRCIPNCPY